MNQVSNEKIAEIQELIQHLLIGGMDYYSISFCVKDVLARYTLLADFELMDLAYKLVSDATGLDLNP
jgi:hypothetical protein